MRYIFKHSNQNIHWVQEQKPIMPFEGENYIQNYVLMKMRLQATLNFEFVL